MLSQALPNNLSQFLVILDIARNFRVEFRNNNYMTNWEGPGVLKRMLMYGFFYKTTNNSHDSIIEVNADRNIFFFDNDYSTTKIGDYYPNLIKKHVNSFFGELQNIVKGINLDQNYNDRVEPYNSKNFGNEPKFIPYYKDKDYWSYLTLTESIPQKNNLSGILSGKYRFTNADGMPNIWLMEMIPVVVMENLFEIFRINIDKVKGKFWGPRFDSNLMMNENNRSKYLRILLEPYYFNRCDEYKFDTAIYNYIFNTVEEYG